MLREDSERDLAKNKTTLMFKEPKIIGRVVEFLLPTEVTELMFTSKMIYSQVRTCPGLIQSVCHSTMYDKHNIKVTETQGIPKLSKANKIENFH